MSAELDKPWLIDGRTGGATTYREVMAVAAAARLWIRRHCRPADTRDALLELTRALAAGAEVTLVDAGFTPHELEALGLDAAQLNARSEAAGQRALTLASLKRLAAGMSGMRLGLYTSGSTGLPKRVEHALGSLARAVRVSPRHADDVWGLAYSPTHVAGVQVWLQALANGNTLVDLTPVGADAALDAIERQGVTHLSATPTYYRLLLATRRVLPGVRSVSLGGELSDAGLHRRLGEMFPAARLHNIYASTEAGTLLESDGEVFTLPAHLAGRLQVQGGRLHVHRSLLGQFNGSASSPEAEWYDTGDSVEIVDENPLRFRFAARLREWINVGGSKVNPHEVELVLKEHPAVADARAFGRPNPVLGQLLCAEVVARAPVPTEAELRAFAAARLQPFKVPRMVHFVTEFATTRTGKARRA